MNLMKMRFGGFEFPVNPSELRVELAGLLRETVTPLGETQVQQIGSYKRRVSGKGYFSGAEAMALYLQLESRFGESATLFLPGRKPFSAILNQLSLIGVQAENLVGYSFTFVETGDKPAGLSGQTFLAKAGESLWDYAYFAGVKIDALVKANPQLGCITSLQAGEQVHIP